MRVVVVGSGLAGSAAAWALARAGFAVEVFESAESWGGQLRTAAVNGVLYEPTGAHIFHTRDKPVWDLVTGLITMRPYRHRVMTEVAGRVMSWPPQLSELRELPEWARIERELELRPDAPRKDNFETWCQDVMGPTLYEWFVEPYTRKQWGVAPTELSSSWAPKRLELRDDGYRDLFRDPYQGWPDGGYLRLIDALLGDINVTMGVTVSAATLEELRHDAVATIVTTPLDLFFSCSLGELPWRGVRLVSRYYPDKEHVLPCGVLNHPGMDESYTRRIETKWMSGQTGMGTVVSEEYPGAPARHYPIEDVDGNNRALARQYGELLSQEFGPRVFMAGRLATYSYIDMDQALRQGLNVAQDVMRLARAT